MRLRALPCSQILQKTKTSLNISATSNSAFQTSIMTHRADAKRMLDERGYSGALIHNTNPAYLLEKAVRDRIVDSYYWKEQCFAINEATLCDRATDMSFIGGTYGQQRPTPFLCLILKLLQLTPERDIILYYLHQDDLKHFKYLTALAAFYVRLTFGAADVYQTLEPLLEDRRKLKRRIKEGGFVLTYMDEFIDDLLIKERVCGITLSRLPPRSLLEDLGQLEERESPLAAELEDLDAEGTDRSDDVMSDGEANGANYHSNGYSNQSHSTSRSP